MSSGCYVSPIDRTNASKREKFGEVIDKQRNLWLTIFFGE
jgi:hypothetical protein